MPQVSNLSWFNATFINLFFLFSLMFFLNYSNFSSFSKTYFGPLKKFGFFFMV